ncbi:hypothetical protein AN396_04095 [Candidatus Epulonipiscium fishelsonii]|uniref:Uncharacterized protein n=1 Tax=Candidatus Epulonipiscium fishelsonii TaxID=77094 RepID=A0ACC8XDV2_9FIRM|nr:hypothetical protein AN396_04095 [Epulopiscium sp. SCG-B11WGA-EpuloA1]
MWCQLKVKLRKLYLKNIRNQFKKKKKLKKGNHSHRIFKGRAGALWWGVWANGRQEGVQENHPNHT